MIKYLKGPFTLCGENTSVICCLLAVDALDKKKPDNDNDDAGDDDDNYAGDAQANALQ